MTVPAFAIASPGSTDGWGPVDAIGASGGDDGRVHVALYSHSPGFYGAEQVARAVVTHLPPGVRVTAVGPFGSILEQIAAGRDGTDVVVTPEVRGKFDLRSARALRRALRAIDPDVVHINLTDMAACLPETCAALTLRGVGVVAVEHHPHAPSNRLQRTLKRAVSRRLRGHVAVSASLAGAVRAVTGERPAAVTVIRNGLVPVPPVERRRDGAELVIGVACRLEPPKGIDVLLRALARTPGVRARIAGEGGQRDVLEAMARELGIDDRVAFVGWLDDVGDLYATIDAYVLSSHDEAMPLSIIEALHRRIAVVATRVGGVEELLTDGVTGVLVAPADPEALAAALARLRDDPVESARIAQRGFDHARAALDAVQMAEQYAAVYAAAARRGSRR